MPVTCSTSRPVSERWLVVSRSTVYQSCTAGDNMLSNVSPQSMLAVSETDKVLRQTNSDADGIDVLYNLPQQYGNDVWVYSDRSHCVVYRWPVVQRKMPLTTRASSACTTWALQMATLIRRTTTPGAHAMKERPLALGRIVSLMASNAS